MGGAVGLPIPEDLPLLIAGVLCHDGTVLIEWALAICYIGVLCGDILIFAIGRRFGPSLFEKSWFRHKFPPRKVKLIRLKLERRSLVMIFLARHLFYLRTVTFLTCGAVRMTLWRFIVADALAALISVPLMIFLGYKFAEHLDQIRDMIRSATYLSGLVVALVIGLIYLYYRRKHKADLCAKKLAVSDSAAPSCSESDKTPSA